MAYNVTRGAAGGATGALGGAAAGAAWGAAGGPIGAGAGAVIGGLAGLAGGFGDEGGGGGEYILSDEEKVLLQERANNQARLREIAGGQNLYDPYADLNVEDNLRARLAREYPQRFKDIQNSLNTAGGATTGQLTDATYRLGNEFTNRQSELSDRIAQARAQFRGQQVLSAQGQLGGGPAPTPTFIADQPKPDYIGQALGQLGGSALQGYFQRPQQGAPNLTATPLQAPNAPDYQQKQNVFQLPNRQVPSFSGGFGR